MGAAINLIGQKFGKLIVIEKDKNKYPDGSIHWICQCECGNIKSINGACLRKGNTKSCGCFSSQLKKLDLTGQKFGRLTVLKEVEKPEYVKQKQSYWLCKCDCGSETIVRGGSLTYGEVKSCGCARKDSTFKNLINKKFGLLTAISPLEEKTKQGVTIWLCKCECGNTTKVSTSNLLNHHVKSCGCHRISFGEQEILNLLEQNNIQFKREYTIPNLLGSKGGQVRFDFCIFDKNHNIERLIEFQGLQHYKEGIFFTSPKENDKIKADFCLKNSITLICIPYWIQNKITLEDLFSDKYKITKGGE